MLRTIFFAFVVLPVTSVLAQKAKPAMAVNPLDAKNTDTGKPLPPEDPELAKYYFAEKTMPLPASAKSFSAF